MCFSFPVGYFELLHMIAVIKGNKKRQVSICMSAFQVSACVTATIISLTKLSHMAEARVRVEEDYPKKVDTGRLDQISNYSIPYVPENGLSFLYTAAHFILQTLSEGGKMYSFYFPGVENDTQSCKITC